MNNSFKTKKEQNYQNTVSPLFNDSSYDNKTSNSELKSSIKKASKQEKNYNILAKSIFSFY